MECLFITIVFLITHLPTLGADRILCSPGFQRFNDESYGSGKQICARLYSPGERRHKGTENWVEAYKTCNRLQSNLLYLQGNNSHIFAMRDFLKKKLTDNITWVGLRREAGFYMSKVSYPYLFRESYHYASKWQDLIEPISDCVQLNIASIKLTTDDCYSEKLPFLCVNDGFPTKPIEHFACPEHWFFTHHLKDPYGCIQVFAPASYDSALQTCESQDAILIKPEDFHGIYHVLEDDYLNNFTSEAYWVKERLIKSSPCEVGAKVSPPAKMVWEIHNCSDRLPFICKKDLRKIDVETWISPKEIASFVSTAVYNKSLMCNLNIDSRPIDALMPHSLFKFLWFKNGVPVSTERIINPGYIFDESKINGDLVSRQGAYQCSVEVLGIEGSFSSNVVDIFFSDVSSYILIGYTSLFQLTHSDYSRLDFHDFLLRLRTDPTWVKIIESISKKFSRSPVYWDIQNTRDKQGSGKLSLILFIKWISPDARIENGEEEIKLILEQYASNMTMIELSGSTLHNVDTCFSEETEINGTDIKVLRWPTSSAAERVIPEPLCLTREDDVVYRKCFGNFSFMAYWGPIIGDCYRIAPNISANLYRLSKVSVTSENAISTAQTLANLTSSPDSLAPNDLQFITSTISNIANNPASSAEIIRYTAATVDNVMSVNDTMLLSEQTKMNTSSSITGQFERIVSESTINETNVAFALNNVAVNTWQLGPTDKLPIGAFATFSGTNENISTIFDGSDIPLTDYEAGIVLPSNLILEHSSKLNSSSRPRLNIIIYKTPSLFQYNRTDSQSKVISPVVHASVATTSVWNLDPPVTIYFKCLENCNVSSSETITCGYWNQSLNDGFGAWSKDGCVIIKNNGEDYICQCIHLTNFGALLSWTQNEDEPESLSLSIISLIGCSLSLFGLGMTILTFVLFRKWRKGKKHQTLVNLSIALMSVLIIFLTGFYETGHEIGCLVVAVLLHYFMLVTFAWMLVEAVLQFLNLVIVYDTYIPRFMAKAMIAAWGIPLLIVSTVLLIDHKLYVGNNKRYCWLTEDAFRYAFAIPALILLAINFVVFVLILYSITCGRGKGLRNNQDERKFAMTRFRATFCIYFLLGLSWFFGFIAVDGVRELFQYLFAITTTMQGFLIFMFFVAQDKAARNMWSSFAFSKIARLKTSVSHSTGTESINIQIGTKQMNDRMKLTLRDYN